MTLRGLWMALRGLWMASPVFWGAPRLFRTPQREGRAVPRVFWAAPRLGRMASGLNGWAPGQRRAAIFGLESVRRVFSLT